MVLYYWDKYQSSYYSYDVTTYTSNGWGPWSGESTKNAQSPSYGYSGYGFDSTQGYYTTGSYNTYYTSATLYRGGGTSLEEVQIYDASGGLANYRSRSASASASTTTHSGYTRGSFIETITAEDNAYINNSRNSDGYWYVRGSVANQAPYSPTLLTPIGMEMVLNEYEITWNLGGDPDEDQVLTEVELSVNGGTTYKNIVTTDYGVSSIVYDFSEELATEQAILRLRHYDGKLYGDYVYSEPFQIIHKTRVGTSVIQLNNESLSIPLYNPDVGLSGKNGLRTFMNGVGICCFELVEVTDAQASPLRVHTSKGIKAISKG